MTIDETDPKRISDTLKKQQLEIHSIQARLVASDWVLVLTAVTKSLVVLSIVWSGTWLLANHVEIPAPAWGIASLAMIGTFGLEALARKWLNGKTPS